MISFYKYEFEDFEYFIDININDPLERVTSIRDLRIMVDSKLQFTNQINHETE